MCYNRSVYFNSIFMNKIIIAFDATNFSMGAVEFIMRRNLDYPCRVKAYFLSPVEHSSLLGYQLVPAEHLVVDEADEMDDTALRNIEFFKGFCERHDIQASIYADESKGTLQAMIEDTRFADLLVVGMESFFTNVDEELHDATLGEILHSSECPVFLVPDDYFQPARIIFSYDGSASSMYAIRQFCHLLPEMHKRVATLVYASSKEEEIPNKEMVTDYLSRHFDTLIIQKLDIDARKYFSTWVADKECAMLVAGAFGRSGFSELFKSSFVSGLLRQHKVPMFIAHK